MQGNCCATRSGSRGNKKSRNKSKSLSGFRRLFTESLEPRHLLTTLFWDVNGSAAGLGGTGTWDLTRANWSTSPDGTGPRQAWVEGSDAVFDGTAGTVSISGQINAKSISFRAADYTVRSGALLVPSGGMTIDVATGGATLSTPLSGDGPVTKTGDGMLTLKTANTFTGGTVIDAGTLALAYRYGTIGTLAAAQPVTVNEGATLQLNVVDALGSGADMASVVNLNGGTLTTNGGAFRSALPAVEMTGGHLALPAGSLNFTLDGPVSAHAAPVSSTIDARSVILRGTDIVNVDQGASLEIDAVVSGKTAITKNGSGALAINGALLGTDVSQVTVFLPASSVFADDRDATASNAKGLTTDTSANYTFPTSAGQWDFTGTANMRPVISAVYGLAAESPLPDYLAVTLSMGGIAAPTVYYSAAGLTPGSNVRLTHQVDASSLPTGRYSYTLHVVEYSADQPSRETFYLGNQDLVNRAQSEFGSGWWLDGLYRLVVSDGGVMLIRGDGKVGWFADDGKGGFTSPLGTTGKLTRDSGGYTLSYPAGEHYDFSAAGLLLRSADANQNITTYTYVDADADGLVDELASVIDPVGHATTLTYVDGLAAVATDFAGRVTRFEHQNARLASVTQPDPDTLGGTEGPTTSFAYTAEGSLAQLTDAEENSIGYTYDFAGRLRFMAYPNGGTKTFVPSNLAELVDTSTSGYDVEHAAPLTAAADPISAVLDARGYQTRIKSDGFGYTTWMSDGLGRAWTYTRDSNGRVTEYIEADPDGTGPLTSAMSTFQYDSNGNRIAAVYADGSQESWTYDAHSSLTSHTDELGRLTTYDYVYRVDAQGHAIVSEMTLTEVDPNGPDAVTHYTYTDGSTDLPAGLLLTVTDPLGRVTKYEYGADAQASSFGQLTSLTLAFGTIDQSATSYEYDAAGNVSAVVDALGYRTQYMYDGLDRVRTVSKTAPDGNGMVVVESYEYDGNGNTTAVIDALGNRTDYVYAPLNSRLLAVIAPAPSGAGERPTTLYSYDAEMNPISATDPLDRITTYQYDGLNRVIKKIEPNADPNSQLPGPTTTFAYSRTGDLISSTAPLGRKTSYAYDLRHRLVTTTLPDPDDDGPLPAPVRTTQYDAAGQVVQTTDEAGRSTHYEYDAFGQLVKTILPNTIAGDPSSCPTYLSSYDVAGNLLTSTDALAQVTSYTYDDLDRLVAETSPGEIATHYTYDTTGHLLSLTDANQNTTAWVYDALGRRTQETDAQGASSHYTYDLAGNVLSQTDRNGRVSEFVYDNLYRRTEERWLDGQTVLRTFAYSYDAAGQLLSASDPSATYNYSYDSLGQPLTITQSIAGLSANVVLAQQFDTAGRRTRLEGVLDGTSDFVNQFIYDKLDRMTSIRQTSITGGDVVARKRVDYAYDAVGQLSMVSRYADLAATRLVAQSAYSYDPAGRLTGLDHTKGQTGLAGYDWLYDAQGRLVQATSLLDGTASYSYDNLSQLVGADYSQQADESYAYDSTGNRTGDGYITDAGNRIASDGTFSYTYDAEGNCTGRTRLSQSPADDYATEYAWDYRNRLTQVTFKNNAGQVTKQVQYSYDYGDRLVRKVVDAGTTGEKATVFVYDGVQVALEFDGAGSTDLARGNLSHRYLWAPGVDQLLADEQLYAATSGGGYNLARAGKIFWALTDQLGTVRDLAQYNATTDVTTIADHRVYDAFGKLSSESNAAVDCLFGFTGQAFDAETGLASYRARWYDPGTGRFLGEDPLSFAAGDVNLYRYVGNDPLNFTDPSGMCQAPGPAKSTPQPDWDHPHIDYPSGKEFPGIGKDVTARVREKIPEAVKKAMPKKYPKAQPGGSGYPLNVYYDDKGNIKGIEKPQGRIGDKVGRDPNLRNPGWNHTMHITVTLPAVPTRGAR